MSIKTTHSVSRKFAKKAIKRRIAEMDDLTDDELASLLEDVLSNDFYNFWVVPKKELKRIKKNNGFYLDDLSNLPERSDAW